MNNQEFYNKSIEGLAAQGFQQSSEIGGECLYRGPNGLKCAIGVVVTDEQISQAAEIAAQQDPSRAQTALETREGFTSSAFEPLFPDVSPMLMSTLQSAHDIYSVPLKRLQGLKSAGKDFGLEIPKVLQDAIDFEVRLTAE